MTAPSATRDETVMQADVIAKNAPYLLAALPPKYHHFLNCLVRQASLFAASETAPNGTADYLLAYVRIDLTEAGGTRSMVECDTERLRGLLQSLTAARSAIECIPASLRAFGSYEAFMDYCIAKGNKTGDSSFKVAYELYCSNIGQEDK